MGWLFSKNQSKQSLIAKRLQREENEEAIWEYIDHSLKGNCLWKILKYTNKRIQKETLFICLDLLACQKGYGYGYKDMDETVGPAYDSVPVTWFKKVPCPDSPCAREWRESVLKKYIEKSAQKSKYLKLEIGKTYSLLHSSIPHITIVAKYMSKWIGVYNNARYKVPVRMIGEEITV